MIKASEQHASHRIIPIILCGGSGSRLWPLSNWNRPKQFLRLFGRYSQLEATLLRCRGDTFDARPIIVGSQSHGALLRKTAENLGIDAEIILEPESRNTCAAILAGTLVAKARDTDAMVMVMAADHDIPDAAAFVSAALVGVAAAAQGHLVTFGVKPHTASTGYGYIQTGAALAQTPLSHVNRFVEKPNVEAAKQYCEDGYLWNSGNLLCAAKSLLSEAAQHSPQTLVAVSKALGQAKRDDAGLRLDKAAFCAATSIAFDHAILEKTQNAVVLAVDYAWGDVGSWDAVVALSQKDAQGNAAVGQSSIENSRDVFVHSETKLTVVLGCNDISVIVTPEAVLVIGKDQGENLKALLDAHKITQQR